MLIKIFFFDCDIGFFSTGYVDTFRDLPYSCTYEDVDRKVADEIQRNLDWWDCPIDWIVSYEEYGKSATKLLNKS